MIRVNDAITVPSDELEWSFARSGGPGGQNVNKVSSKAILRWFVGRSVVPISLSAWERMRTRYPSRFTINGELMLSSSRYRDQERNRLDCVAKLVEMIEVAIVEPKARKVSKPSKGSRIRRLEDKQRQSERKQLRRPSSSDD